MEGSFWKEGRNRDDQQSLELIGMPDNTNPPPIFVFFQLVRAVSHPLSEGIPMPRCWLAGRCQNT